jgi:hypothetical protein
MIRVVHPGSGSVIFYPSRIPGSKRHRIPIPDPDPQHCRLYMLGVQTERVRLSGLGGPVRGPRHLLLPGHGGQGQQAGGPLTYSSSGVGGSAFIVVLQGHGGQGQQAGGPSTDSSSGVGGSAFIVVLQGHGGQGQQAGRPILYTLRQGMGDRHSLLFRGSGSGNAVVCNRR